MPNENVSAEPDPDQVAFEGRFPLAAFEGVAKALKIPASHANLRLLWHLLVPEFYPLYLAAIGKEPSHEARLAGVKKLSDAADQVLGCLGDFNIRLDLPADLWLGPEAPDKAFFAKLERLAKAAKEGLASLHSTPARRGRPVKNAAFREPTPDLARIFERLSGEPAECPYWLPDSGVYGCQNAFYDFVVAVWEVLRTHVPEARAMGLPDSKEAVAEELRKHWPEDQHDR